MDKIIFDSKEYHIREIDFPETGCVLVSSITLNDVLLNDLGNYVSEEANTIDEQIFYFVEEEMLQLEDSKLIEVIKNQLML
jgi:hypothetical protein